MADEKIGASAAVNTDLSERIQAPLLYASTFHAYWSSTEFNVILSVNSLARSQPTNENPSGFRAGIQPAAILAMSPQSAKDLSLLLQDGVRKYEDMYGPLETDFARMSRNRFK
ncbi:hypothetical protein [Rhizobium sp. NXC24]|uniref:hypothetical protein n=1 Tax=Rhizobium sp. NXC24 TaxID=2048897 RepID=UPI000CDF4218|nr:hypothetical protein [Rhizobium sp. NXC24]AVA20692.1 hypothetical protein NXC24_CH01025 [Rhizobium sp. NXC24]